MVNVWHLNVESLENVYQLNNNELHSTMHGHTAAITCLAIASNGLFAVSGSEDKLVLVWGLTVGNAVFTFSVSFYTLKYKVGFKVRFIPRMYSTLSDATSWSIAGSLNFRI